MTIWLIVLFVRISYSSDEPDVEGEALIGFLKVLNDSRGRITDWNDHFTSPCFSWSYITCRNGHVISLDLQNNDLSGLLPGFLGDMVHLETLNLANNKFSGSIPANWGQLSNLKHLDLSSNNLTGRIPMQLFSVPTFNFGAGIRGDRLLRVDHFSCKIKPPWVGTLAFPGICTLMFKSA
ncbi:Leucine-rich repeat - like 10 [Theobroma cacao]|nr:Leucine-rich repeat - like 10 [Theobroma cacao]